MNIHPLTSEKAVKIIEADNTLVFVVERRAKKNEIKDYLARVLSLKIVGIRTLIRQNQKIAYVRLSSEQPAIDVATRLGMM